SAAYCSYLIPALQEYALTPEAVEELATRLLFFFLAAMLVNRFAVEIRRRAAAYQSLARQMTETNRRLAQAQEEARRSERLEARVGVGRAYEEAMPHAPMDERLCEQVFHSLALNAYEAMEPGGGTLRVEIAPAQREAHHGVEITFRDTGPGIPPELCQQIFNPFFTTKKTGVGLGLSIVSKIVDEHRGFVRVESQSGHGACFRVFLPVAEGAASATAASPPAN